MRAAVLLCLAVAAALTAFAFWGLETQAGRTAYDEMDGLYPLGAAMLAGLLTGGALVLNFLGRRRK